VLPDRIELSASPLPRGCSTTELRQRTLVWGGANLCPRNVARLVPHAFSRRKTKKCLSSTHLRKSAFSRDISPMTKSLQAEQRAQRLAAKLRENLKRRKGQAKARSDADAAAPEQAPEKPEKPELP